MHKKKQMSGKLNSRKNRDKAWALKKLLAQAQAQPLHTCRKETSEEYLLRVRVERAQRRAEELWAGKLYDLPLGPTELAPRWLPPESAGGTARQRPAIRSRPCSLLLMPALLVAGIPAQRV